MFVAASDNESSAGITWVDDPDGMRTVTYHGNGNTGGTPPIDPGSPYAYGVTVLVLGAGNLTRVGHSFSGWNTQSNGQGTHFNPGQTFNITTNMTLYAQWTPIPRNVTFNRNDGSSPINTPVVIVPHGGSVGVANMPSVARPGFTLTGWNTQPNGSGTAFTANTIVYSDIIVYAQWQQNQPGGGTPGGLPPGGGTPPPVVEPEIGAEEPDLVIPFAPIHHAYMVGFPDGYIRPHGFVTRADAATIVFRLITDDFRALAWSQTNPFSDVQSAHWFNNAVSTMTNAGVIEGMPDGTFQPDRYITRAEFAALATRFFGMQIPAPSPFPDTMGHWAMHYINTAAALGWIQGYPDGTFRPEQSITRAEVAALMNRILVRHPRTVNDLLPGMLTWRDNMDINAWYYLDIQEATNSNMHVMHADGRHKTWTVLIEPRPWTALEHPWSTPDSIFTGYGENIQNSGIFSAIFSNFFNSFGVRNMFRLHL